MIPKVHAGGSSVGGAIRYVMDKKQEPRVLGGTVSGADRQELTDGFSESSQLAQTGRPIKKHVWHATLSYQQADIQNGLSDSDRMEIAGRYVEHQLESDWQQNNAARDRRGAEPLPKPDPNMYQWCVVAHGHADGKENPHDHIVMIRRGLDGSTYGNRRSGRVSEPWAREIEREYNLAAIPERNQQQSRSRAHPPTQETYHEHTRGVVSPEAQSARDVRGALDRLPDGQRTLGGFSHELQESGYSLHREVSEKGRERFFIHGPDGADGQPGERWRSDKLGFKLGHLRRELSDEPWRRQERTQEAIPSQDHSGNERARREVLAAYGRVPDGQRTLGRFAHELQESGYSLHREVSAKGRERFFIHGPDGGDGQPGERWRSDKVGLSSSRIRRELGGPATRQQEQVHGAGSPRRDNDRER